MKYKWPVQGTAISTSIAERTQLGLLYLYIQILFLTKREYEFNSHLISPFNTLYHSTITTTLSSSSVQLMLSHRPKRTDVTQVLLLLLQGRRSGIGEGNRGGVPAPLPPSKFFGRSKSKTCKTCYFRSYWDT
jgi:hypothetical protein